MDWDTTVNSDKDVNYRVVLPFLEEINRRTPIRIDECLRKLSEGLMQSFIAGPHSAIFGMMDKDGTVWIYGAAGVLEELLDTLPRLELWYYYRGGVKLLVPGRKGWIKVLYKFGYRWRGDRLEKDLVGWVKTQATTLPLTLT